MEFNHYSVLLKESIDALQIKPDGIYVDATLGGAGHSSEILKQLTKGGKLYSFDQDITAIKASRDKLAAIGNNFEIIQSNFVNLKEELESRGVTKIDGIIFDLGVSSPQLDERERGFSYHQEARLDMRMDQSQGLSAYEVVNEYSFHDLLRIISRYGEEQYAKQIAREIERTRAVKPIETTLELVDAIKRAMPEKAKREKHPAKRTFQAIRIEVNQELTILPRAFVDAINLLNVEGIIAIITFHSLEDKIAAKILKEHSTVDVPRGIPVIPDNMLPILELVNRKAIMASDTELEANNRSHSARLRVGKKIIDKNILMK
jgi:16S rRNA (cytosine1402-N4)-methyltransferase